MSVEAILLNQQRNTKSSGLYAFTLNNQGHLIVNYKDADETPDFSINNVGHLIYTFQEG